MPEQYVTDLEGGRGSDSTLKPWQTRRRRLFRTSAFRLGVLYAILFSLLSSATLGFIYWSTQDEIESQVDSRLRLETDYLINLYKSGALTELLEAIQRRNQIDTYGRFYNLERDTDNEFNNSSSDNPLHLQSIRTHSTKNMGEVVDLPPGSPRAFNPVRVAVTQMSNGLKLTIGHEISDEKALLEHTFGLVVGATALTLIFAIIGGGWIGLSVLRRIDSINHTASEIMDGDLGQRIPVTHRQDELDEIAIKINAMLNRIEDLMESMQQVTNNVAHDLRSPLTRLKNRMEVTLLEERSNEEYQQILNEAIADADTLIGTFNAMLSIARLEAGIDHAQWSHMPIGDLVDELAELYGPVAEEQGQAFSVKIQSNPTLFCNRHLIAQAITNLIDNAMKYCPEDGKIEVTVQGDQNQFSIIVADNGPGIPESEREHVMERFVRLENERNSTGNGLGLSLVKAVASIHGAKITLSDNNPGLITTFSCSKHRNKESQEELNNTNSIQ